MIERTRIIVSLFLLPFAAFAIRLPASAAIFWDYDFEGTTIESGWTDYGSGALNKPNAFMTVTNQARTGSRSLRAEYEDVTGYNPSIAHHIPYANVPSLPLSAQIKNVFFRFAIKIDPNFVPNSNNSKLVYIRDDVGNGDVSAVLELTNNEPYLKLAIQGAKDRTNTEVYSTGVNLLDRQWHEIQVQWLMNTTGVADGALRIWADGNPNPVFQTVNRRFGRDDNTRIDIVFVYAQAGTGHIYYDRWAAADQFIPWISGSLPPPPPPPTTPPPPPPPTVGTVADLTASAAGSSTINLTFTEVGDGTGQPAKYDVRMMQGSVMSWGTASSVMQGSCASPLAGASVGASRTCTVTGLAAGTQYQFQLLAFRGTLNVDAVFGGFSNVASAATAPAAATTDVNGDGSTTIVDVQLAVNQALGLSTCGSGDANRDGLCSVTDVQRVVNAALGG